MSLTVGRWWRGVLAVESLAMDAVGRVCTAVGELGRQRGSAFQDVSTTPELVAASFAALEHLRVDGRAAQGWAPLSGFAAASDGWVRLHANYPHHAAALTAALGVTSREDLARRVGTMTAQAVEEQVLAAGGIATVVRSEAAWRAHPHGASTHDDPWCAEEIAGDREPLGRLAGMPLAGVRVLDLTRVIAGPTCSQVLACLGADVLRLDPPHRPELLDQYLSNGMGKRSVEVDLRADAAYVRESLLPRADVVLLGYRPGSLAKFGLDPDSLLEHDPTLVVGSLSAWGEHGPWGARPGFDSIVQAATGIAEVCGTPAQPGALPVQALDHATGYLLAAGVISLLARGRGGVVRASLLGAARTLLLRPRSRAEEVLELPVPTVRVGSGAGPLVAVPPPILLDGRTIERDVAGYGSAAPSWV